jgi:ABC-type antimicrobial peptide transport system permease subunit
VSGAGVQQRLLEDFPVFLLGAVIAPGGALLELPHDRFVDVPDHELGHVPITSDASNASTCSTLARMLESLLYGVSTADTGSLAVAGVLLLGVTGFAAWIPARRATQVDAVQVLRA